MPVQPTTSLKSFTRVYVVIAGAVLLGSVLLGAVFTSVLYSTAVQMHIPRPSTVMLFDIIVYDEGRFEFQKVHFKHTDYYDWTKIAPKARYQSQGRFPDLPIHIKTRYDAWYEDMSTAVHKRRFKAWEKPNSKTLDDFDGNTTQTLRKQAKDLKAMDEKLARAKKYIATLINDDATQHEKMATRRWARKLLEGDKEG